MPRLDDQITHRCGYVAIIGRPNVGKSTLLNHILGIKLSITSRKPQTTRHQILGIKTDEHVQSIYVDTPGLHQRRGSAINKYMNRAAASVMSDVDVLLFVIQAMEWTDEDEAVLQRLESINAPVILVVNKIDQVSDKETLLPFIGEVSSKFKFHDVIPAAAVKGLSIDKVELAVAALLPENEAFYPEDQLTNRSMRFLAAEIIREKLVRELGQELPYTTTVNVDKYEEDENLIRIHATIYVESKGQKTILIGRKGDRIKSIGTKARKDIETMVETKVYLNLWVKVREGWSNDEQALRGLGYGEE
ncbi:MAG: GTPase Era [Gammaproteobacteria bacterium]|nr:GTPase Era [Gammaproteobacteria bacterium]